MTTPRKHAETATRYFMDNTTNCWARNEGSNNEWTLMPDPRFNVPGLEYYVGHESPPPDKHTINLPAATIELRSGEHYAGLMLNDDGTPLYHLVLMAARTDKRLSWEGAKDWASKIGGSLPTRREMSLIYTHCHAHVKHEWHWLSEPYEGDSSYAWACYFGTSSQDVNRKSSESRAIAVRRILIGGQDE